MNDPFKTNNKIGLPLAAGITQTLLPVVCGGNGKIQGYLTIAETAFNGTETEVAFPERNVPVKSVTLPVSVDDGTGYGVKQYMAAYWPASEESKRPWIGLSAFVDPSEDGYVMRHYMPTQGHKVIVNRGALITGLQVSMSNAINLPEEPSAPEVSNASISWAASMDMNSAQLQHGFFDFNWVALFKAKFIKPSVTKVMEKATLGIGETSLVTITLSQPAVGFNDSKLTATGGTLAPLTTSDYKVWTTTFTASEAIADTSNSVSVSLANVVSATKSIVPNPVRIEIVSNPESGEFKSTLVPNPTITPLGGVEFNTIRIIKLQTPAVGNYTFTYKVTDDRNQSTTCTLTLTII